MKAITSKNTVSCLFVVVVLRTFLVFVTTSFVAHLTVLVLRNVAAAAPSMVSSVLR